MTAYRIREVDGADDEIADELRRMHLAAFGDSAPPVEPEEGHWWFAFPLEGSKEPVAFGGIKQARLWQDAGYLNRSGVMLEHRGHGLQRRLLRAREAYSRRNDWNWCISDTTENIPSANNLIRAGYTLYTPQEPWGFKETLYWMKELKCAPTRGNLS